MLKQFALTGEETEAGQQEFLYSGLFVYAVMVFDFKPPVTRRLKASHLQCLIYLKDEESLLKVLASEAKERDGAKASSNEWSLFSSWDLQSFFTSFVQIVHLGEFTRRHSDRF